VDKGAQLVNHSGEALTEIIDSVKNVSEIIDEIATASNQQSLGIEHITSAMTQVDTVVQANSSKTHELSTTAQRLSGLATGLNEILTRFVFEGECAQSESTSDDLSDSLNAMKNWIAASYQHARERVKLTQSV